LLGGMAHETNTFNPYPTPWLAFRALQGQNMLQARRGTNSEVGGMLAVLEAEQDLELVPSIYAHATPAGYVTREAVEYVLGAWLEALSQQPVDGVCLALHGAMTATGIDDAESYLLERLRQALGPGVPIVASMDLHATLTPEMAHFLDALTIYRTYPHMDMAERGREAARILVRTLAGDIRPTMAVAKRPLLVCPPQNVLPGAEPMASIMARARQMEAENPKVIAACPAHGFAQQDVPWAGVGAAVTTDGAPELAHELAEELAEMLFAHRDEYQVALPDAAQAIKLAKEHPQPPVAIADSGDNIGGGTPGDGTALLSEILRQGVDSALVHLVDAQAAQAAAAAGIGGQITLAVGGRSDPLYGPPVKVTVVVRALTDGVYLNRAWGGYSAGVVSNMGLSARLELMIDQHGSGVTLIVSSQTYSPNNILHAKSLGVYPEDYRMTVCKGGLAFREAYKPPVANSYIQADTPGYSSSDLDRFAYRRVRRPIAPLDDL